VQEVAGAALLGLADGWLIHRIGAMLLAIGVAKLVSIGADMGLRSISNNVNKFAGPVERSRFMAMTGLPQRTARRVLASLLDFGILASPSPRAAVSFGIPLASLRFLFPRLWPEAEADTLS
jgi:hypothetical protein